MAGAPNPTNDPTNTQGRRRSGLVPIVVLVLSIVAAFVIFNLTRDGSNYQEEQINGPDPVETTT